MDAMENPGNKVKVGNLSLRTKGPFSKFVCEKILRRLSLYPARLALPIHQGRLKEYYAQLFGCSKSGVARMELYENMKASCSGSTVFVITGSDVIKAQKITGETAEDRHAFVVATREQQYTFSAKDAFDCDNWVKNIQDTLLQPMCSMGPPQHSPTKVTVENDIYVPAEEVCRQYTVTVSVESRQKLAVDGKVRLLVENGHITIMSLDGNRIVRWGIEHLRRFGYTDTNFHVEAGRKSQLGEGEFVFITNLGKQIHTLVSKEKEMWRHKMSRNSQPLPAGQVAPPITMDPEPLTQCGHIYEELTLLPVSTKASSPRLGFKETPAVSGYNPKPEKPPRVTTNKNYEVVPAMQPTIPIGGQKTALAFSNGQGKLISKSLPTNAAAARPYSNMLPAAQALQTHSGTHQQPVADLENAVYSEPKVFMEAWKEFSRDDNDSESDRSSSTYDSLQHFTPVDKEVEDSHYTYSPFAKPPADGAHVEEVLKKLQQKTIREEPIYAQVDKTKKLPPKKD
ncbi:docking protein 2 isoform X1 [Procambarus clarkii]|uniref:docking protein 2 isoform X1 n=1 Tax=Procambarus clarkii TaxID=6728 RepID=UPI003743B2F6